MVFLWGLVRLMDGWMGMRKGEGGVVRTEGRSDVGEAPLGSVAMVDGCGCRCMVNGAGGERAMCEWRQRV